MVCVCVGCVWCVYMPECVWGVSGGGVCVCGVCVLSCSFALLLFIILFV